MQTLLESTVGEVQFPKKQLRTLPRGRLRIAGASPDREGSKHARRISSSFVAKPAEVWRPCPCEEVRGHGQCRTARRAAVSRSMARRGHS
eukprot:7344593-Pyramimonas_sp.AAC.1